MRVVFVLAVVSLIAAALPYSPADHRKCVIGPDNLPGPWYKYYWDKDGWRCSNIHPQDNVRRCLLYNWLCDGYDGCGDGEDEGEICGGYGEDRTCTNKGITGWRCKSGSKQCIRYKDLCDGVKDCDDGEDEEFGGTCNSPALHPGCHATPGGCHTCAANSTTILTSLQFWNGSEEDCRRCDPWDVRHNGTKWKRCHDGYCFDSLLECDNKEDCKDGSDEMNCPWYTRVSTTTTLAACFGIVSVSLIVFILMKKLKWIDTRVENDETPMDTSLVHIDNFVEKIKSTTEMDEEIRNIYENIHQNGHTFDLIVSTNIFFNSLKKSHEITNLILGMETQIHGGRRQALLCLRVNAGSNADVERLLSFEGDPGCIKKTKKMMTRATDAFLNQSCIQRLVACFPDIKKWSYIISKMLFASIKVTLFLWDLAKDLVLWFLLYTKIEDLNSSESFLLWVYFSLIFWAQCIVGFYITSEYKTILSIPDEMKTWKKVFVLMAMFLLTPCLPSLVIFKATVYATDMAAIVAKARNDSSSRPSIVLRQIDAIKEKHRKHLQIYAYARAIEATLETFPQVLLLSSFITERGGLGGILLNQGNLNASTSILFIASLPYSYIMIVTAIIGFINVQKCGSLGILTSSILGVSYLCQLGSNMASWIYVFGSIIAINRIDIFWTMIILGKLMATWIFTFVWTTMMVEPFAKASMFERLLHVLVNTFVTIPYRDSTTQDQRRKSTEIFWHLICHAIANVIMVILSWNHIGKTFLPLNIIIGCLFFQLLGGFFMWIFYKKSHWAEINNTGCNFCFFPSTPCVCSPAAICKMFGCFFLGFFQIFFGLCCFLCCDLWFIWCRCLKLNRFNWRVWRGGEIPDRDTLAIQELLTIPQTQNMPQEDRLPSQPSADVSTSASIADNTLSGPTDPAHPSTDPVHPSINPAHPSTDPARPSSDPVHPSIDPAHPSTDPAHTSIDPAHPSIDPAHTSIDPTHPSIDPAHPSIDRANPSIDPTHQPTSSNPTILL